MLLRSSTLTSSNVSRVRICLGDSSSSATSMVNWVVDLASFNSSALPVPRYHTGWTAVPVLRDAPHDLRAGGLDKRGKFAERFLGGPPLVAAGIHGYEVRLLALRRPAVVPLSRHAPAGRLITARLVACAGSDAAWAIGARVAAGLGHSAFFLRAVERRLGAAASAWRLLVGTARWATGRQQPPQHLAGLALGMCADLLRRPLGYQLSPGVAALRPQIDEPVGALDDVQVVLDHQHRVPRVHQPLQNLQQLVHVGEMEAGGGLVQDVEGVPRGDLGQLGGQLDPLRLPAGQRAWTAGPA